MIRFLTIASFLITLASCQSTRYIFTSFHEPANEGLRLLASKKGKQWIDLDTVLLKPSVGTQKVMRDPSMVQGPDGTFHLVWTSSWKFDLGFGYASSKDLVHWSEPRHIPVMQQEPTTVNVWAPEIFYDADASRFIIVWASCIPGRFARGIEADSNNHRLYYTATKDFQSFSKAAVFYDPGYSVIDATIVRINKENFALVFKDNTRPERNIHVARGRSPLGPWINPTPALTGKFTEGPSVLKRKNEWLIYFDSYDKKTYDALRTTHFHDFQSASVNVPLGHKHGTIVPMTANNWRKLIKPLMKP